MTRPDGLAAVLLLVWQRQAKQPKVLGKQSTQPHTDNLEFCQQ